MAKKPTRSRYVVMRPDAHMLMPDGHFLHLAVCLCENQRPAVFLSKRGAEAAAAPFRLDGVVVFEVADHAVRTMAVPVVTLTELLQRLDAQDVLDLYDPTDQSIQ